MLAAGITCPTVTAVPFKVRVPAPGKDAMMTDCSVLAGVSLGSVKPKSAALKVCVASSLRVMVLSAPAGASFLS